MPSAPTGRAPGPATRGTYNENASLVQGDVDGRRDGDGDGRGAPVRPDEGKYDDEGGAVMIVSMERGWARKCNESGRAIAAIAKCAGGMEVVIERDAQNNARRKSERAHPVPTQDLRVLALAEAHGKNEPGICTVLGHGIRSRRGRDRRNRKLWNRPRGVNPDSTVVKFTGEREGHSVRQLGTSLRTGTEKSRSALRVLQS